MKNGSRTGRENQPGSRRGRRIAIFVDGANLRGVLRTDFEERMFNHGKFMDFFRQEGIIVDARFYINVDNEIDSNDALRKRGRFFSMLISSGYSVVSKNLKAITDQTSGNIVRKGNMDVEIAVDATIAVADGGVDEIVLVATDCDFAHLAKRLREHYGVMFTVVGSKRTAHEVREVCSRFLRVDQFIERRG